VLEVSRNETVSPQLQEAVDIAPVVSGSQEEDEAVPSSVRPRPNLPAGLPRNLVRVEPNEALRDSTLLLRSRLTDKESREEEFNPITERKEEVRARNTEILAVGRRLISVEEHLFGPGARQYSKKSNPDIPENFVTDNLRGAVGRYWSVDTSRKNFTFIDADAKLRAKQPFSIRSHPPVDDKKSSDFGRSTSLVELRANKDLFKTANNKYSKNFWQAYVAGGDYKGSTNLREASKKTFPSIVKKEMFFDHSYEMPVPFSKAEIEEISAPQGALVANIDPEYNFYMKNYESVTTTLPNVPEATLPSLHVFMLELNSEEPNPEFKKFITLDGTLKTDERVISRKVGREKFDIKKHPIGQYFDIYGRQYAEAQLSGATERLGKKFSNLVFPIEQMNLLKLHNDKKEMFPAYVDLSIPTDRTTTLAQMLFNSGMLDSFVTKVSSRVQNDEFDIMAVRTSIETIVQRTGDDNPRKETKFSKRENKTWDVSKILKEMGTSMEPLSSETSVVMGDHTQYLKTGTTPEFKFFKSLQMAIFRGKLQSLLREKFRTYEEMVQGAPAYSETVLYRVSKHERTGNGPSIQNFWIPNTNEIDVLNFVDTQVKYDRQYTYKIWAYQFVVGTKYNYTGLDADFEYHAGLKVHQEPSLKLVETLFYEESIVIADDPPVSPDFVVVPYKGVDNKLLFLLSSNVGNYYQQPIFIQPGDQAIVEKVRQKQKIKRGDPLRFSNDDHPSTYQIFRIDYHPSSYGDFTGKIVKEVDSDVDLETLQGATSAAFVDDILPNRKYFYTFRTVDIHGLISNPTVVIQVEMINENGTIFLQKRQVDFLEMPRADSKPLRRFMQFVPSVMQTLIDEEKSGYDLAETADEASKNIHLGVVDDSLWGKKFKVRLTSKSTGKKLDFNFGFDHKNIKKS
jgi:hypothetical protein